jgi:hypothetical protein
VINYEICVLQALREQLLCNETWASGPDRYCNPEQDLRQHFAERRETHYAELQQTLDADPFVGARAPLPRVAPHARTLPRLAAGVPGNG